MIPQRLRERDTRPQAGSRRCYTLWSSQPTSGEREVERPSWDASSSSIEPLSNVEVTPSDVIITEDLPFAKPDTIEVNIVGDNLVEIKAEMRRRVRFDDFGVRHFSGEFSRFHTQIRTPVCLEPRITAMDFKAGVLRVRIPRRFPRL